MFHRALEHNRRMLWQYIFLPGIVVEFIYRSPPDLESDLGFESALVHSEFICFVLIGRMKDRG